MTTTTDCFKRYGAACAAVLPPLEGADGQPSLDSLGLFHVLRTDGGIGWLDGSILKLQRTPEVVEHYALRVVNDAEEERLRLQMLGLSGGWKDTDPETLKRMVSTGTDYKHGLLLRALAPAAAPDKHPKIVIAGSTLSILVDESQEKQFLILSLIHI